MSRELVVDNFAGGGGASTGIALALGRPVDIAINHDPEAVAMHRANHPDTEHHCESVWEVNPRDLCRGAPVGLVWLSPDCKHFSKAKGGRPVEKKIRGLAWVALRWAAQVKPRIIMLENVEEFVSWGPLVEGEDGRLRPCPQRKGRTFAAFVAALRRQGYAVEWTELRACDFGAPTIRKRLFLVARRDGRPIVWPEPTHGDPRSAAVRAGRLRPWRTAAECIDFSLPCPSIFLSREQGRALGVKRPLADATLRRIAKGMMRYAVDAAEPFIVGVGGRVGQSPERSVTAPDQTITTKADAALCVPHLVPLQGADRTSPLGEPCRTIICANLMVNTTGHPGGNPDTPLHTITTGGHHALVNAFLAKHYGGKCTNPASSLADPISTITAVDHHQLVTSNLVKLRGTSTAQGSAEPLHTISAQGQHFAEVRAFLVKYYGEGGNAVSLADPVPTVTSKERFGLVTIRDDDYVIADIGLRMLTPRELYRAQGFPESYIIGDDPGQGLRLTKEAQVRMCGNSVCSPVAAALVAANFDVSRISDRTRHQPRQADLFRGNP